MRITLNLASRPFVELRPLFLRLRLLAIALMALAIVLFITLRRAEDQAERAEAIVHSWTQKTQRLQREWQADQALMREPSNAATLDRSEFLNQMFTLKSFSWTAALMDLENVLPKGLQVISIDPQMTKDGHVQVRLRINGPRDKAVDLMANLEKSPHFLHPRLVGETAQMQQGQNHPGVIPTMVADADVNFDILAEFNAGDLVSRDVQAEQQKSGTHNSGVRGSHSAGSETESGLQPGSGQAGASAFHGTMRGQRGSGQAANGPANAANRRMQ